MLNINLTNKDGGKRGRKGREERREGGKEERRKSGKAENWIGRKVTYIFLVLASQRVRSRSLRQ
jgi:hypothetical protein